MDEATKGIRVPNNRATAQIFCVYLCSFVQEVLSRLASHVCRVLTREVTQ